MREAYQALRDVGFSDYEARAYCALLEHAPANGYQIAKQSGIPRAKVYECLDRLVDRGAVVRLEASDGGAKAFAPTDFRELLDHSESRARAAHQRARKALERRERAPRSVEVLWRVNSLPDLIRRGRSLIAESNEALHVALWADEFQVLLPDLLSALERGVRIALVLYSPHPGLARLQEAGAGAVGHGRSKRLAVAVMGRQFVLAADRRSAITGSVFEGGDVEGIFSMNRGLVTNAVDLVNHEIYLERIISAAGAQALRVFGEDLAGLDAFDSPGAPAGDARSANGRAGKRSD